MKILFLGEYSNVHHTLSEALHRAGHEVLLVSDGDGWKNYQRDVDLRRRFHGPLGSALYLLKLFTLLPRLRGYDVVQLINPVFLDVKPRWNRWMFNYLKRNNKKVSLGCFGDDYLVVSRMQDEGLLEYTDFLAKGRVIDHPLNQKRIRCWCSPDRKALSQYIVENADCLVACLYEYYKVYDIAPYQNKLHYLPLPCKTDEAAGMESYRPSDKPLRILLALQKERSLMKGTEQIEKLLLQLVSEYPEALELHRIESVPFEQYCREVDEADVVVDQLYSYTPAMTALEAMGRGKVVITGGEEYDLEGVHYQAPVINLRPFEDEENLRKLEENLLDKNRIAQLSAGSQAYVLKYHDADRVAGKCVQIWSACHSSQVSSRLSSQR